MSAPHFVWQLALWGLLWFAGPAVAIDERYRDLSDVWELARDNIYPGELSSRFLPAVYAELHAELQQNREKSVADVINPFLESLGVSHTHLYDKHDLEYYLFRSMFTSRDIGRPQVVHIGVQTSPHKNGLLIDAVLDAGPAYRAGIRAGDIVTSVNGVKPSKDSAFFPYANRPVKIEVIGPSGDKRTTTLEPVRQSLHAALAEATRESVRIVERNGLRLGYIHLWAGTDEQFLNALTTAVLDTFSDVDGIVLDLRDGYGGAWWPYLDPFFPDTREYFVAERIDRDGNSELLEPEYKIHEDYYAGPLAVLINERVRSGKEALAYQFKKTRRATLLGSTTAGAFVGGLGGFADQDRGFILYLSVFGMRLDGQRIERRGIAPHIEVPQIAGGEDPQLERAIVEIARLAGSR